MIVKKVDIWHLKLPFFYPFKHKLATHEGSENLVVKVTTDAGLTGYGEGVPRVFVTGETLSSATSFLAETLVPAVLEAAFPSHVGFLETLAGIFRQVHAEGFPAACCALEMSLLDAAGGTWQMPLSDFLGGGLKESVHYSAVLPLAAPGQLARFFQLVKTRKMKFLKLKVGGADDLAVLEMARSELGWGIDIRVDANAAWSAEEAVVHIKEMGPFRISAVEQPVAKEDFAGLQQVSRDLDIPVIADESLCTEADARRLIEMKACGIFNIRLSKCGGLGAALRIRKMAKEAAIECQLGCHVGETSILSAGGRHFALCSEGLAYVEGSFSPYLLAKDPVKEPVVF